MVLFRILLMLLMSLVANPAAPRNSQVELDLRGHFPVGAKHQLRIMGVNHSRSQQILVIRIDDSEAPGYGERVNLERTLAPGPFRFDIMLGGLRTPSGRLLDLSRLGRIILFQGKGRGDLAIDPPRIVEPASLPIGSFGWDLGPKDGRIWPGFELLTRSFPGIEGDTATDVDRGARKQAADPLTDDGIKGIERLRLPLAPGTWYLTLWLRDPGEWEYLPHPLLRRLSANGRVVWQQGYRPMQWIEQVYLGLRGREAGVDDDAWSLYGGRPEGRISFAVTLEDAGLLLETAGEQPEAGYIAAILAEPHGDFRVREQVTKARRDWWRRSWTTEPSALADRMRGLEPIRLAPLQRPPVVARDTAVSLRFRLHGLDEGQRVIVEFEPPGYKGERLDTELRWGQWRLQRGGLSSTLLRLGHDYLRSGAVPPIPSRGLYRELQLRVYVPVFALGGRYQGTLRVRVGNQVLTSPLAVVVPPVDLPAADRPVGVYLERAVHFDWFKSLNRLSDHAVRCDLSFLRRQGITGIAPPLTTPVDDVGLRRFNDELRSVKRAGFMSPYLAYAPFKRLFARLGLASAAQRVAAVQDALRPDVGAVLLWAISDEPGNPGSDNHPARIARHLKAYAPGIRLAGQLNRPGDLDHIDSYDTALLNPAFSLDGARLERLRGRGVEPWLYNMERFRAAAGFYLWRSGARGYLQWHARMPTADPFDPTDGREDDVQFLLPQLDPCPFVQEVDGGLFELAEGIVDLRWLLWLQQRAADDGRAKSLLLRLREEIPLEWSRMKQVGQEQLAQWRDEIVRLATPAASATSGQDHPSP